MGENRHEKIHCRDGSKPDSPNHSRSSWSRQRHIHKKVWPLEYYTDLAQALHNTNKRIKFVLTGSVGERYLSRLFLDRFPHAVDLIGQTSVQEVGGLMDLSRVLVTHDTGTMHIACALKRPLIAMFAATHSGFTGPWPRLSQFRILEAESMLDIPVTRVYDEVIGLLTSPEAPQYSQ